MSYALGKLFTITENKTGHPKLKRQALFKDDEMSTNFCLDHLPNFCNNDDVIYKKGDLTRNELHDTFLKIFPESK